jgi:DNA-binding beta-propeller fold protein YncE
MRNGSEGLVYDVVEGWGPLPEGWELGMALAVDMDSRGRVYVFCRGTHPVVVFDRDGGVLDSWGDGVFTTPHYIEIDRHDHVWCTDSGDHTVRKFTAEGELLLTLGVKDVPGEEGAPFNRPTGTFLLPSGEFYVADGYVNSRVHKYSADCRLEFSWGGPGDGPGEFEIPHGVWVEGDRVYVADRQNNRIQVFTLGGEYLEEWGDLLQPCNIYFAGGRFYVPELQGRVSILDGDGGLLTRLGGERGHKPGEFYAPHGVYVDSNGDLYVAETLAGARVQKFVRRD